MPTKRSLGNISSLLKYRGWFPRKAHKNLLHLCKSMVCFTRFAMEISILQRFFVQIYQNFPWIWWFSIFNFTRFWRVFWVTSCRVKNRFISNAPNFHFEMVETLRLKLDIVFYEGDNDGYEVRDHLTVTHLGGSNLMQMLNFREFFLMVYCLGWLLSWSLYFGWLTG